MLTEVNETASNVSEYDNTSAPCRPCTASMAIHHNDTPRLKPPMRNAAATARRHGTDRCHAAWTSHNTGAGAIIASAVALGDPTVKITNAKTAGSRHLVRVADRTVSPTNQPTDAHGSSISDVRDRYGRMYGESW